MARRAFFVVLPLLAGCASILGIEEATCDPEFDPQCDPSAGGRTDDGADDDNGDDVPEVFTELDPLCEEYCRTVSEVCTAEEGAQQYASEQACVAVCEFGMELGAPGDKDEGVDTAYCRYENALGAGLFGELDFDCATAGLGANDACGDICDVYCRLLNQRCAGVSDFPANFEDHAACVEECQELPRTPDPFDYEVNSGNTLECRLWHVQAAFSNAVTHCPHAAGAPPCTD